MTGQARHVVIDGFLGDASADRLLAQIVASQARFTPSEVRHGGASTFDPTFRSSLRLPGRVGVDLDHFRAAIAARFDELCDGAGVRPFPVHHTECSVVASLDGDFYQRHVDTGAAHGGSVRVLSCVYYLHHRPRRFSGGELALHPLTSSGEPLRIEPVHNRLVAFPAFVPHEVRPTICPSGVFADARFSINCWLRRAVQ